MHGSTEQTTSLSTVSAPGAIDGVGGLARLVHALATEFNAPVGVLDRPSGQWLLRHGVPPELFPAVSEGNEASGRPEGAVSRERVTLSKAADGAEVTWLWLPLAPEWGDLAAAVGFAHSAAVAHPSEGRWGPVCPPPALLAWGESVARRLRRAGRPAQGLAGSVRAAEVGSTRPDSDRPAAEGGEGITLARLIRRFRISDPPERFQQLACNTLRAALGVQVVAWIPVHHNETVVVSGELGQLSGAGFRALIPPAHSQPVLVQNQFDVPPDPEIRSLILASADVQGNHGWVVAINPMDGRAFTTANAELLQPVASLIATQQTNARVYADLKELLFGVIRALTAAIDAKDPYTSGHSERVARIAVRIAEELGMPSNQRSDLYLTGLLHDVGKIGIDDAVLKKPGPLTPDEYRQIQKHVEIGVQILADLKKLNHLLPGVRHHHESLDGTGYPCGLAGEAIPWEARILAVADSYDAMSSTRPYRRRLTPGQIDEILQKGSGVQWDPKVIDALFACRMDLEMIRQKGLGESLQAAVSGALGRT